LGDVLGEVLPDGAHDLANQGRLVRRGQAPLAEERRERAQRADAGVGVDLELRHVDRGAVEVEEDRLRHPLTLQRGPVRLDGDLVVAVARRDRQVVRPAGGGHVVGEVGTARTLAAMRSSASTSRSVIVLGRRGT
jgi:hypothetical protein